MLIVDSSVPGVRYPQSPFSPRPKRPLSGRIPTRWNIWKKKARNGPAWSSESCPGSTISWPPSSSATLWPTSPRRPWRRISPSRSSTTKKRPFSWRPRRRRSSFLFFPKSTPKYMPPTIPSRCPFSSSCAVRGLMILFYPFVKAFTFLSSLIFPFPRRTASRASIHHHRGRDQSSPDDRDQGDVGLEEKHDRRDPRDIASRPVKEIMTPRPRIKAIEIGATSEQILEIVQSRRDFPAFPFTGAASIRSKG